MSSDAYNMLDAGTATGSQINEPTSDGYAVGGAVGGSELGLPLGSPVGPPLGSEVGSEVGSPVGPGVGPPVGPRLGLPPALGSPVGCPVGFPVGGLVPRGDEGDGGGPASSARMPESTLDSPPCLCPPLPSLLRRRGGPSAGPGRPSRAASNRDEADSSPPASPAGGKPSPRPGRGAADAAAARDDSCSIAGASLRSLFPIISFSFTGSLVVESRADEASVVCGRCGRRRD